MHTRMTKAFRERSEGMAKDAKLLSLYYSILAYFFGAGSPHSIIFFALAAMILLISSEIG